MVKLTEILKQVKYGLVSRLDGNFQLKYAKKHPDYDPISYTFLASQLEMGLCIIYGLSGIVLGAPKGEWALGLGIADIFPAAYNMALWHTSIGLKKEGIKIKEDGNRLRPFGNIFVEIYKTVRSIPSMLREEDQVKNKID